MRPAPAPNSEDPPGPLARLAAAVAGPALIVVAVLVVLHDYAFGGKASFQTVDVLSFSLPMYCFLGRSLLAGEIPGWNPFAMGGMPFASDPQSGWTLLSAMGSFTALPCDRAIGAFIVFNPLAAGLGLYAFLRSEGLTRVGATAGGLTLSLAISASLTVQKLPFASTLAWSAVMLALASRFVRATAWPARIWWALGAALAWTQIAASYMTLGVILGTAALVAFLAVKWIPEVRSQPGSRRRILALAGLLCVCFASVSAAFWLPRLAYVPRTTLGRGYGGIAEITNLVDRSDDLRTDAAMGNAQSIGWPLRFATSPSAYLGAIPLLLSFVGFASRRHRKLALAFGAYGLVCYLAATSVVAHAVGRIVDDFPAAAIYTHAPSRFSYGVLLAAAVVTALGIDSWVRGEAAGRTWLALAVAVAIWGAGPLLAGASPSHVLLPAIGAVAGAAALILVGVNVVRPPLIAVVIALDLGIAALAGQAQDERDLSGLNADTARGGAFLGLLEPEVDVGNYVDTASHLAERIGSEDGGRFMQTEFDVRRIGIPMLGEIESVQGYNSVQLPRFFVLTRVLSEAALPSYHVSIFREPHPLALDLLRVDSVGATTDVPGSVELGALGRVHGLLEAPPAASLVHSWRLVRGGDRVLKAVMDGSRPPEVAIVERDPGIDADPDAEGTVSFRDLGTQRARAVVETSAPALLLVRDVFDENWKAEIDGRPASLLRANYLLMAVPVPAGRHVVDIAYRDPWLARGLWVSGAAVVLVAGCALVAARARRRATGSGKGAGR